MGKNKVKLVFRVYFLMAEFIFDLEFNVNREMTIIMYSHVTVVLQQYSLTGND